MKRHVNAENVVKFEPHFTNEGDHVTIMDVISSIQGQLGNLKLTVFIRFG